MKLLIIASTVTLILFLTGAANVAPTGGPQAGFDDVQSIFDDNCVMCHAGPKAAKGLRLDSYGNVLKGGERGRVVVAGLPEESELVGRLRGTSTPRMPLSGPPWLDEEEMRTIEDWIRSGASGPGENEAAGRTQTETGAEPKPDTGITYADVAPIIKANCVKCHDHKGLMGPPPEGLVLASYREMMNGTERTYVVPGNPGASELVRKIRGQSFPRMPMDGPPYLSDGEIGMIERWVALGAPDESGLPAPMPVGRKVRLRGRMSARSSLDGLLLDAGMFAAVKKKVSVDSYVEVRGRVTAGGGIAVEEIRKR